jgi:ribosomal protein L40E
VPLKVYLCTCNLMLEFQLGFVVDSRCNYVNFQRNSECRECNATRPLLDLRPGDWKCSECNFVNFSKNRVCRKCDVAKPMTQELRQGDWICPK